MIIERQHDSPNGAVNPAVWDEIQLVRDQAHQAYMDFVRQAGGIRGENYVATITPYANLDTDIQEHIPPAATDCLVEERVTEYGTRITVFDMATGTGVQHQIEDGVSDYYDLSEDIWKLQGSSLLEEIFKPGSHPELAELAQIGRSTIIDPTELSARLSTPEEDKRMTAVARLSQFTIAHLNDIQSIYHQVAYPEGRQQRTRPPEDNEQLLQQLQQGKYIGLRTGTFYLDCAKHEIYARKPDDELRTAMGLNYEIPIGPIKLRFGEDIEMAVDFGMQTTDYFESQDIAVNP